MLPAATIGMLLSLLSYRVAVNQWADRKCVEADQVNTKEKGYNCGDAYALLNAFILYGASRVNWVQVNTIDDISN